MSASEKRFRREISGLLAAELLAEESFRTRWEGAVSFFMRPSGRKGTNPCEVNSEREVYMECRRWVIFRFICSGWRESSVVREMVRPLMRSRDPAVVMTSGELHM